jgi:sugar/nucleoside kinase (ribokinase family)
MSIVGIFQGLLTIDLQFHVSDYPPENSKTKADRFDLFIGGPATNAAITFGALGGTPVLQTAIGQNEFSSLTQAELHRYNVQILDYYKDIPSSPTFASIISSKTTGERTIFSYHPPRLDQAQQNENFEPYGSFVLIDGFFIDQAIPLIQKCKAKDIPVILDGGSWKKNMDQLLSMVDIAICSENFMPPGVSSTSDVLDYLTGLGIEKSAITRGHKPIIYHDGEASRQLNVASVEPVDTLASGDIFHGAFCYYWAQDQDFENALSMAAKVATKSCMYYGPREWINHWNK